MPQTTRNGQLQPAKIVRAASRATERCRNRCKRKPPTREPQQNCHPTVKVALSRLAQPPIQAAYGDSCFRLAKQSNHCRGTHFITAGWAARKFDFGDRILSPVSGPDLGPLALYLTVNRFSSPTTKHKSGWGENLGVGNHSSGGGSPHGSSRCSYKIIGGKANPCILGMPLRK